MARTFSFLQVDMVGRYAAASLIIALKGVYPIE